MRHTMFKKIIGISLCVSLIVIAIISMAIKENFLFNAINNISLPLFILTCLISATNYFGRVICKIESIRKENKLLYEERIKFNEELKKDSSTVDITNYIIKNSAGLLILNSRISNCDILIAKYNKISNIIMYIMIIPIVCIIVLLIIGYYVDLLKFDCTWLNLISLALIIFDLLISPDVASKHAEIELKHGDEKNEIQI